MKLWSDPGLVRTQRWMQAFILAEGDNETALEALEVQAEIPKQDALAMVLPSATLTSLERVGIYRDMYLARLEEALEADYPGVLHFLGEEAFHALAARYVDAHPSRSYTLNRLGDGLPGFLGGETGLKKHEFLHDLARLELALTEVFDEEESAVLSPEAIAGVPAEAWETARLQPIAALRLLSFRYPVSEYLGAVDEENPFPAIRKKQTWVAAYRNNFRVRRLDLKRPAFELLTALVSGTPVGAAVEKCRTNNTQLFTWFQEWTAEGLFQSVSLD
jgi:hypothetical protein